MGRHLRTLLDLEATGIRSVLDRAHWLKQVRRSKEHPSSLNGCSVAILLEKPSTRTRISFEVAIHELGGYPLTLNISDTQLGRGETIEDTGRMLSRYVHGVVYRTFGHDRIEKLAKVCTIPVINGLSDKFHPCQVLADLMTVQETWGKSFDGIRVAWIGDGNNMAHSWILAAALLDFEIVLACPDAYGPAQDVLDAARRVGHGKISIVSSPEEAVRNAQVVTTDVWASMGQEHESEKRREAFDAFQVNARLLNKAHSNAIFLHCLPAHRGEEVTADVIDGDQSKVWDQAENRLHVQKALLERLISEKSLSS